jgi:aryl-alcohol dehydrogenase-like predicted oxidoreductase
VNFFDTAPAYDEAEEITGQAVGSYDRIIIATKVVIKADLAGVLGRGKPPGHPNPDFTIAYNRHNPACSRLKDAGFMVGFSAY